MTPANLTPVEPCNKCGGAGIEACTGCGHRPRHGWNGVSAFYYKHGACQGARRDVADCPACNGTGQNVPHRYVSSVPAKGSDWPCVFCSRPINHKIHALAPEGFVSAEAKEAWLAGANGCSEKGISEFVRDPRLTPVYLTPSQQSRADALADAATLRRVKGRTGALSDLRSAADWGEGCTDPRSLGDSGEMARDAARAAFRACPMLRGE